MSRASGQGTVSVPLPQHGGCLCGSLRYRLNGAPLLAYACHCHDCQTRSGSAFALTLVVRRDDLEVAGPVEARRYSTHSGRDIDHTFCPECRVRVFAQAVAAPDYASLRVGTLDDASWVVPIAQTWTESALPWAVIPNVRVVRPEAFDVYELGRAWREAAPDFAAHPA